jgi:hypothetical protein
MRMGSPFAGRKVIRCKGQTLIPGSSSKSKRRISTDNTIVASCSAKEDPMQVRGPAPKGR